MYITVVLITHLVQKIISVSLGTIRWVSINSSGSDPDHTLSEVCLGGPMNLASWSEGPKLGGRASLSTLSAWRGWGGVGGFECWVSTRTRVYCSLCLLYIITVPSSNRLQFKGPLCNYVLHIWIPLLYPPFKHASTHSVDILYHHTVTYSVNVLCRHTVTLTTYSVNIL